MGKLRELYDGYPMTVVRVGGFLLGVPAVCIIMLVIHELLGYDAYQKLYAPMLAALGSVHFFFLRKAADAHNRTYHEAWNTQNSRFDNNYCIFLTVLIVVFAIAAVYGLFEG